MDGTIHRAFEELAAEVAAIHRGSAPMTKEERPC